MKEVRINNKGIHKNGIPYEEKGAYLICDGGYHKWTTLMCPIKHYWMRLLSNTKMILVKKETVKSKIELFT